MMDARRNGLVLLALLLLTQTTISAQTDSMGKDVPIDSVSVATSDSLQTKRGFFKKFLDYFNDANKEKKNKKFDFSVIGGPHYSSDTKFGLGLVAAGLYRTDRNDSILPPSNVSLYGDVSTVGFYLLGVRGNHLFPQEKYRLNYNLYFYSFPSLYWGRGYDNGANSDNESDYKRFQAQVKVDFMFRVAKSFYIGPMAVFDYIDGRDFEKPELWEGMSARTTNTSLGLSLLYDSRDFLTNAYQGYYLRIDQRFSPAFHGNKYAFSSTELTTSYYHPVWKGGVLAGQFHTLLNYGNPPWGLMATLGSSYSMRGYYEGRYRDKCAMDAQIELRQQRTSLFLLPHVLLLDNEQTLCIEGTDRKANYTIHRFRYSSFFHGTDSYGRILLIYFLNRTSMEKQIIRMEIFPSLCICSMHLVCLYSCFSFGIYRTF